MSAGAVPGAGAAAGAGRERWVAPASLFLGLALALALAALVLSIRTTADVRLECPCAGLTVPVELTWPVPDYVGSVHARGFRADIKPIRAATVTSAAAAGKQELRLEARELVLEANPKRAQALPTLDLRPSGGRGGDSVLRIPAGATVRGGEVADSWGPCVALDVPQSGGAVVHLRSEGASLPDVNRMRVRKEPRPDWMERAETVSVALTPDRQLVTTDLTTEPSAAPELAGEQRTVTLRFKKGLAQADLLAASTPPDQRRIRSGTLTVKGCAGGTLWIDGRDQQPLLAPLPAAPADVTLEAKDLEIVSVEAVKPPKATATDWALKVTLTGKATSVRLGGKNLAPTLWDDVVHGSTLVRLLAGAGAVVFALVIIYFFLDALGGGRSPPSVEVNIGGDNYGQVGREVIGATNTVAPAGGRPDRAAAASPPPAPPPPAPPPPAPPAGPSAPDEV